jgi:LysR family transcriptional regulator, transcriptional activator of nhaA
VVLADHPIPSGMRVKAFNHLLGESEVALFAAPTKAAELARGFPHSLDGADVLWPGAHTALRRSLDAWCSANGVAPKIVGEFDDSGLLKAFARAGAGAFAAPEVVADELQSVYGVKRIGTCTGIRERFYAITLERRIRHPAVAAISASARGLLIGG